MSSPIIILAIAEYGRDRQRYLRNLNLELQEVKNALKKAKGHSRVISIEAASIENIMNAFDEADRILAPVVGFHFAGHGNGYELMMRESVKGKAFAHFLGSKPHLQWVFLNSCASVGHVADLHAAGIRTVIATAEAINDNIAREFAVSFYEQLSQNKSLKAAFEYYPASKIMTLDDPRTLYREMMHFKEKTRPLDWPWIFSVKAGATEAGEWSLATASGNPLFGLPEIPPTYDLPTKPFRALERFGRPHAEIFFGRAHEIRQLYMFATDSQGAAILLLYGQSGVGKSSLLEAGLWPRLESSHEVIYLRYTHAPTLLESLNDKLGQAEELSVAWKSKEAKSGKPLLLIFDQLEELFTRPGKEASRELARLFEELKKIFLPRSQRPQGKVILGFRKEYLPEIKSLLTQMEIEAREQFLQKLNKAAIIEIVNGLTSSSRLQAHYQLHIQDELPQIIADDLLEDPKSVISPVLQILLTKMWEEATEIQPGSPAFSVEIYRSLKRSGILLSDFIRQKLADISRWNQEAVASGLVLDLLMFHTTPLSTAEQREIREIRQRYSHRIDLLDELITEIRKTFLLIDVHKERDKDLTLRLAHDTLGPLVRELYEDSDKPGQLADRILTNKVAEYIKSPTKVLLDENSLNIVEKGQAGMRVWEVDEQKLVAASHEMIRKQKRVRKQLIGGGIFMAIVLLTTVFFLWLSARNNVRLEKANTLFARASLYEKTHPTAAMPLFQESYRLDPKEEVKQQYYRLSTNAIFYHELTKIQDGYLTAFAVSPEGQWVAMGVSSPTDDEIIRRQKIRLFILKGKELSAIDSLENPVSVFPITKLRFADENHLIGSTDKDLFVWDIRQGKTYRLDNPKRLLIKDWDANTREVFIAYHDERNTRLWNWVDDTVRLHRVWETVPFSGMTYQLPGGNEGVDAVSFYKLPDAKSALFAAIAYESGEIALWKTGEENYQAKMMGHQAGLFEPVFIQTLTNSGLISASISDSSIRMWDLSRILPLDQKYMGEHIHDLAMEGNTLFLATDKGIQAWDADLTKKPYDYNKGPVFSLQLSYDSTSGTVFRLDRSSKKLHAWNLLRGTVKWEKSVSHLPGISVLHSYDNQLFAGSRNGQIYLMSAVDGEVLDSLKNHSGTITSLTWIADRGSGLLLSAGYDSLMNLWEVGNGKLIRGIQQEMGDIDDVIYHPSSQQFSCLHFDGTLSQWDLNGKLIRSSTQIDPGSLYITAVRDDGAIALITQEKEVWFLTKGFDIYARLTPHIPMKSLVVDVQKNRIMGLSADGYLLSWKVPGPPPLLAGVNEN